MNLADIQHRIPANSATYDVLVAGGGPAGLAAALASAILGARTLLIEARPYLGGVAATAPWMPMNRLLLDNGPRGFVHDRLVAKIRSFGPAASVPGTVNHIDADGLNIHPDYLRIACFELLDEAGCDYRVHSPVTEVLIDHSAVHGVVVEARGHRAEFRAAVTIDASGDGEVARLAGVPMEEGREEDGRHMPVSLVFTVGNADVEKFLSFYENERARFHAIIDEAGAAGCVLPAWYSFHRTSLPGTLCVNNGAAGIQGNIDGSDPAQLTLAERVGLQLAADFVTIARKWRLPGLENCHLDRVGPSVSVRDTRRIVGEYRLTQEDVTRGTEFPDVVARKYGEVLDANQLLQAEMTSGAPYPYRSMLPMKVENLLVAGRCGSATFYGHAAGKSMGNMMSIGQAAGAAAALAVRQGISPRSLDVRQLQQLLTERGVKLWG